LRSTDHRQPSTRPINTLQPNFQPPTHSLPLTHSDLSLSFLNKRLIISPSVPSSLPHR
jgi:hypothetical protein